MIDVIPQNTLRDFCYKDSNRILNDLNAPCHKGGDVGDQFILTSRKACIQQSREGFKNSYKEACNGLVDQATMIRALGVNIKCLEVKVIFSHELHEFTSKIQTLSIEATFEKLS